MRICHTSTMTGLGGVERLIIDYLANNHNQFNHFLLTTSSNQKLLQLVDNLNIPTFQPVRKFRYDPSVFIQMVNWLTENDIQVVHTYNANSNAWGNIAANFAHIQTVCSEHGSIWWIKPPIAWLDRFAYRRAKLIIANSEASKTLLMRKYHLSECKIHVVYNGVPRFHQIDKIELRKKLGLPNKFIIGSIGRLDTPKNFDLLIDAANIILRSRHDLIFLLIGGGPLEAQLKDKVTQLGIQDNFIMLGWREDARELMQILDIFVSTSIHEAFGNVLVEASLAGKPIIAPSVDGIPEIIQDGENGLLLKPTQGVFLRSSPGSTPFSPRVIIDGNLSKPLSISADDLVDAIQYLIEKPDIREKMGEIGRTIAQNRFTIDSYVKNIGDIYSSVIHG